MTTERVKPKVLNLANPEDIAMDAELKADASAAIQGGGSC